MNFTITTARHQIRLNPLPTGTIQIKIIEMFTNKLVSPVQSDPDFLLQTSIDTIDLWDFAISALSIDERTTPSVQRRKTELMDIFSS